MLGFDVQNLPKAKNQWFYAFVIEEVFTNERLEHLEAQTPYNLLLKIDISIAKRKNMCSSIEKTALHKSLLEK